MELAKYIDYTNLKPDSRREDVERLCRKAAEHNVASVCVNPSFVKLASKLLSESEVKVCTVVGFPLGANSSETKTYEASDAAKNGASEIDMVINISFLKDKAFDKVKEEIASVVSAVPNCLVKVIIETCLLNDEEKVKACELAKEAGAHFVKTSTGFSSGGATVEDVALMKKAVGDTIGVKASGGIRDYESAIRMIEAGASRLGTSQLILK